MKTRWRMFSLMVGLLGGTATAQEKKDPVIIDEKAALEAIMKAATPGEAHKKLAHFEGKWEMSCKMWMDPSKPPTESKATSEVKWIFGGRYLEENIKGEFGGMKFDGHAIFGYDNTAKSYHSYWIDSMGTGAMTSTGKVSADGKTFTYIGESYDPVLGKKVKSRSVVKLVDKDTHVHEMYMTMDLGGKEEEMKCIELTYKRK